jgi:hypothetical protein
LGDVHQGARPAVPSAEGLATTREGLRFQDRPHEGTYFQRIVLAGDCEGRYLVEPLMLHCLRRALRDCATGPFLKFLQMP